MSEWSEIRWEKETDNGSRYYRVLVHQDLLGTWLLTRVWGGSLRQAGQMKEHPVDSREEALGLLEEIDKRRKARGYRVVQLLDNETK
ncbi:MAG: WGR domain-containing protein [Methylococcaceae bacterium]|nr:WGR domain-containing protein [Methylococcaceae bacterium]